MLWRGLVRNHPGFTLGMVADLFSKQPELLAEAYTVQVGIGVDEIKEDEGKPEKKTKITPSP